jgi:hypothetical protein
MDEENETNEQPLSSVNSGTYNPGPPTKDDLPTEELSGVQAHVLDLALEEFAEGPYGAATNEEKLGKVSEWKEGQAFSGRFRDSNLISGDRKVAMEEQPAIGRDNLEKQN